MFSASRPTRARGAGGQGGHGVALDRAPLRPVSSTDRRHARRLQLLGRLGPVAAVGDEEGLGRR